MDDAVPAGASQYGDGDSWSWVAGSPAPTSGATSHQSSVVGGLHQHFFAGATDKLTVGAGEKLVVYVYIDPANVPSEVMLQWNSDAEGWNHRAYWGANNIGWGTDGTGSRRYMGALPGAGQWVRLEVPASQVGLEGKTLNGMAFTLYGGRATWDRAGKSSSSTGAGTQWLVSDQLGSPRMVINQSGGLTGVRRHDYFPFGEEVAADATWRTTARGYAADAVRQKFTGYERDSETGLDFAQARYFASAQGRFTGADPLLASGRAGAPQTWNRYTYALNNPLRLTDPSGMIDEGDNSGQLPPAPPPPPVEEPVIPPVDEALAGSERYQEQMQIAPQPKVTPTAGATRPDMNIPMGNGLLMSGIYSPLSIQVTDESGRPMAGVSVTESVETRRSIPPLPTGQNPNAVQTDANGTFPDIVTCNALATDTPASVQEARLQVSEQVDNPTECVTVQTLVIAAPGYGYLGTAQYTRTFTNLDAQRNRRFSGGPGRRVNNITIDVGPVTYSYPTRGAP